ncbi:hypothetical protein SSX86_024470 [Deinandra increscens subsp. villosa]|uniref:Ubiquitin-like protease family profile domain-containing protein n=1 Tax=Deinandra increscens subsp. villosa TaxID=3103831 RepID=A0AAP0GNM9_9ASTR
MLKEYRMGGDRFTYMEKNGRSFSKLDRFLVCDGIYDRWPEASVTVLPKRWSDHSPILLKLIKDDFGPCPFKLYSSWMNHGEFDGVIKGCCEEFITDPRQSPDVNLLSKLKFIKEVVKRWRQKVYKEDNEVKEEALEICRKMEEIAQVFPLSPTESKYIVYPKSCQFQCSRMLCGRGSLRILVDLLKNGGSIGNPHERDDERIRTGKPLSGATVDVVDTKILDEAHLYVLRNIAAVETYTEVFAMDELSGAVVTSYSMYLYEQIKNGSKIDHGICFVTPTATMNHDKKGKARNVDDSSRLVADRLGSRKNNDIVLVPYNPGRHWVLGVLDMKKMKCYYLDSIRPTSVNLQFKTIVDAAIGLYNAKIGSKKASKFNWVNSACPLQPGTTECGYYVLKFMKEVVRQGLVVLEQNKIGGDRNAYTDVDFDEIREEWLTYACHFIFMDEK